jgi:hypothetical protein
MKKISTCMLLVFVTLFAKAQTNFEGLLTGTAVYFKGSPGVPGFDTFTSGVAKFVNRNDTSSFGDYWSGWAYSKKQDTTSVDYSTNDISAIAGIGQNNSDAYGVAYVNAFSPERNRITFVEKVLIDNAYFTNTTIAYRSMQNGDFVAKKFGGATGNDPDFYRLDITGWNNGAPIADTIRFYLADFRDTNNANDYIINNWTNVNLTSLGLVDSITYSVASSDTSSLGINTPTYFCMDNLSTTVVGFNEYAKEIEIAIFPNPIHQSFYIRNATNLNQEIFIYAMNGACVFQTKINALATLQINASK